MGARWARVIIDQADFIVPPEDCNPSDRHDPQLLIHKLISELDNPITTQRPANYIKQLKLNFQFRTPSSIIGEEGFSEYVLGDLPCSEDIQYSLTTLLPYCTALSEIDHDGVLHQENLDQITNLVKAPLDTLQLRKTRPNFCSRWRHVHLPYGVRRDGYGENGLHGDFEHITLRWDNLMRLRLLRTLEIGQLFKNEGVSLAKAVAELGNLERLLLVTGRLSPEEPETHVDLPGESPSPLTGFFDYIFPAIHPATCARQACKLPRRLRSLALGDPDSRNVCVHEPSPSNRTTYPALTDIFLDVNNLTALTNMFNWLQMPALERFAVPAVITIPALDQHAGAPPDENLILPDTAYPDLVRLIKSLIERHETTLHQVTLLNAWQDGGEDGSGTVRELNHDWCCSFFTQELVLGTASPDFYRYVVRHPRLPILCNSFYMSRRTIDGPRWGSNLQRLRIDQLDFDGLVLDGFVTPELEYLKILMLHPWSVSSSSSNLKASLPSDMKSFKEGRLALDIISENLPRLRVLVIGGYRFWIERRLNGNGTNGATGHSRSSTFKDTTKLWHLSTAQKDRQQYIQMARDLSSRDWSFLDDLPAHPRKDDPRAVRANRARDGNYLFGRWPSLQMRKHRNYMVLTRENPDADVRTTQPGKRIFRHERKLTDLASWWLRSM